MPPNSQNEIINYVSFSVPFPAETTVKYLLLVRSNFLSDNSVRTVVIPKLTPKNDPNKSIRHIGWHLHVLTVEHGPRLVLELQHLLTRLQVQNVLESKRPRCARLLPGVAAVEVRESRVGPYQISILQHVVRTLKAGNVEAGVNPLHSFYDVVRQVSILNERHVHPRPHAHDNRLGFAAASRRVAASQRSPGPDHVTSEHLFVKLGDRIDRPCSAGYLDVAYARTSPDSHAMGSVGASLRVQFHHFLRRFAARARGVLVVYGYVVQVKCITPRARDRHDVVFVIPRDVEQSPF
mmetsp:Transcript_33805/g.72059  ORF Transcript_33805/g.72059 Transcript_33805/m.72059 type:complete len:293 (+) Transcript_33805:109-987(+)